MSTRKRKQDEELVALPSDESEEEEECVSPFSSPTFAHRQYLNWLFYSSRAPCCASMRGADDAAAVFAPGYLPASRMRLSPTLAHHG